MRSAVAIAGAAALSAFFASVPAHAAPNDLLLFPRPASIQERVRLWTRVYAEVDTNGGLIHDADDLGIVYEVIRWPKSISGGDEEDRIGRTKAHYVAVLKRLASGKTGLTPEERRVLALFPPGVSRDTLLAAADRVRFQRGLADRFRDGLIRSGQWMPHIRKVFRDRGLPEDLAMLPHVESSFNPLAYSKVGAAGLWQFMPSTGARYMRIDRAVDERYDPWRASEAAAALMRDNFRVTGTWPLAITSYNHGAGGMMRAVKQLGTQDIGVIIDRYDSDSFGFASKNFYACFLAAGDVDRNAVRYFGPIQRERPAQFEEVVTRNPTSASALVRTFGVDLGLLRELNLGLRDNVWSGRVAVPSGYALRVPAVAGRPPADQLAASLPKIEPPPPAVAGGDKHRVKRGETLASIARSYGVSAQALAQANKLKTTTKLKLGQTLRVPTEVASAQPAKSTRAAASGRKAASKPVIAAADPPPAARSYTVKRGETLSSIARKSGIPVTKLAEANGMHPSTRVKAGQRLRIPSARGG
jgi:membrane-bound lytic murein transglycosylase D